jgi:hypothetical protein
MVNSVPDCVSFQRLANAVSSAVEERAQAHEIEFLATICRRYVWGVN